MDLRLAPSECELVTERSPLSPRYLDCTAVSHVLMYIARYCPVVELSFRALSANGREECLTVPAIGNLIFIGKPNVIQVLGSREPSIEYSILKLVIIVNQSPSHIHRPHLVLEGEHWCVRHTRSISSVGTNTVF